MSIFLFQPLLHCPLNRDCRSSDLTMTSLAFERRVDCIVKEIAGVLDVLFLSVEQPSLDMTLDERNLLDLVVLLDSTLHGELLVTLKGVMLVHL